MPEAAAGIRIGGPVSLEGMLAALYDGLRLATLLICVGAANVLANPKRLLKLVPGALHEFAVAVTVALTFAPQLVESAQRVRRARRLRGGTRPRRHVVREIGIPVLQDALDRSLLLAAGMDSRGYGRVGTVARRTRMLTGALLLAGLVGVATGVYGLLDASTPRALGVPMLFAGLLVAGAGLRAVGPPRRAHGVPAGPVGARGVARRRQRHHGRRRHGGRRTRRPREPESLPGTAALARAAAAPGARDPRRRTAGMAGTTGHRPFPASAGRRARRSVGSGPDGRARAARGHAGTGAGPVIRFEHVTVTYPDAHRPVLRDVDLTIPEGELVLVVGRTGVGKSTLLGAINGLVPHFTGGHLAGRVLVDGRDTRTHPPRELADVVGVVGQDPLAGFVTDTVEEELAYGMEQLALPADVMRKRVEETLDLLGLAALRDRPLRALSGGQQQRVAIGSVLTTHPRVLVLDEPTSALDPTAAEEVLAAITRLVHDLGTTVVVAEHRLERVVQYADRVVHLAADGRVTDGDPEPMLANADVAPPVVELGRIAGWSPLPLSVRDARRLAPSLRAQLASRAPSGRGHGLVRTTATAHLTARRVSVRYGDVVAVRSVDLDLFAGEVVACMGRNGSGKSSLLWALQGSGTRSSGTVAVDGVDPASLPAAPRRRNVALVPQTPGDLLYHATVARRVRAGRQRDRLRGGQHTCAPRARSCPACRATRIRTTSRRVNGSGSCSRSNSSRRRPWCCSTSRRAGSTTGRRSTSSASCATSRPPVARS